MTTANDNEGSIERNLISEDYSAADEVLRRYPRDDVEIPKLRRLLAEDHRSIGDQRFRFKYLLREPLTTFEKLKRKMQLGEISADNYNSQLRAHIDRDVDQEMLDTMFDEIEVLLESYSAVKVQILRLAQGLSNSRDCELDEQVSRLTGKSLLFKEESLRVLDFLAEIRAEQQFRPFEFGPISSPSAAGLAVVAIGYLQRVWKNCRESKVKLRTAARELVRFDSDEMPNPQKLLTLLYEEHALARIAVRERSKGKEATASTIDNITIHSQLVTVNADGRKFATSNNEKVAEEARPRIKIERWSDFAIGIDENREYFGFWPAPDFSDKITKSSGHHISLPGRRWSILLEALANSSDGQSVALDYLVQKLEYFEMPGEVVRETRARGPALRRGMYEDLKIQAHRTGIRLKNAMSDLRRELRKWVDGPSGRHCGCLERRGNQIFSGFRVAFLMRDEERNLRFGQHRS